MDSNGMIHDVMRGSERLLFIFHTASSQTRPITWPTVVDLSVHFGRSVPDNGIIR